MIQSNWIAYVGPFKYPSQQAGAQRIYGIARSLTNAGYHTVIGSGESVPIELVALEQEEDQGKLAYIGLGELPPVDASTVSKSLTWFIHLGNRTVRWLDQQPTKPSHVVIYAPHALMVFRLLQWCRRNGVALIIDVVEWYDSTHVLGGALGPFNISMKIALRLLNPRSDGIIAISSYLAAYYQNCRCPVVRIPPTLDVKNQSLRLMPIGEVIRIVYAGFPGKKDLIGNIIEALLAVDSHGKRIHLIIVGPKPDEILRLPQLRTLGMSSLPGCVEALGPLPHSQVLQLIRNADYVPLLRPPLRYAQAGFPTKIPESLALGTPVICNITSDLGQYIHDGVEGIVCVDHSVSAFADALQRALSFSVPQRIEMRKAARAQAERSFDYRVFTEPLANFLSEVKPCA